jgi:hypothetical protein
MKLTPLRIVRDDEAFTRWWAGLTDDEREQVTESLELIPRPGAPRDDYELDSTVHSLFLTVFQDLGGTTWLNVEGLRPDAEVMYLSLDVEPAYDGDGCRDGATVVASMSLNHVTHLSVQAYVDKPWHMFIATVTDDKEILAELIDLALALVNADIADRDRFTTTARQWAPSSDAPFA